MGQETTGVVAQTLGRSFLGFEIDGNYFNMSVKRIQEATKNTHSKKPPIIKINANAESNWEIQTTPPNKNYGKEWAASQRLCSFCSASFRLSIPSPQSGAGE